MAGKIDGRNRDKRREKEGEGGGERGGGERERQLKGLKRPLDKERNPATQVNTSQGPDPLIPP